MIKIDKTLCTGCGLCVNDCTRRVIHMVDEKAELSGNICFTCGHCVSICPFHAVSIPGYDMADVEEYNANDFSLDTEQLLRAIKFRRSVRAFTEQKVEKEKLEKIIQAGRYTATASNRQGNQFIIVQEHLDEFKSLVWEKVEHISENINDLPQEMYAFLLMYLDIRNRTGYDYLFFNAPVALYIVTDNPIDAGLAAQNMELLAVSQGLGVVYSGYLTRTTPLSPLACKWLGLQEKPIAACLLMGYPQNKHMRTAPRKKAAAFWR